MWREAKLISKSNVKDGARTLAHSLRIRDERLSGPDALLASNPDNIFWICKWSNSIDDKCMFLVLVFSTLRWVEEISWLKADWKYLLSKALAAVSLYSEIPSVRKSGIAFDFVFLLKKRLESLWICLNFVTQIFYKGLIIMFHSFFQFFSQLFFNWSNH